MNTLHGFSGNVGTGRVEITPPIGVRNKNWGPADVETATSVHRPFTATALAIRAGSDPAQVMIAVDGTWWRRVDDERRVRSAVLEATALEPEQLVIALSHTHAGCVLTSTADELPGGEPAMRYLEELAAGLIRVARQALDDLRPGTIEWLTGHCELAGNRETLIDGKPYVAWNPSKPADPTVLIGRVTDAETGTARATVVNYACHPTTLAWQNTALSPDYVGAMRELVENGTSAPVLFLQGAAGDLAPREQYTGDPSIADRHGRALGHAVLAALETAPLPGHRLELTETVESGAPLAVWSPRPTGWSQALAAGIVQSLLPLQTLATEDELIARWGTIDPRSLAERLDRVRDLRDGYLRPGMTQVRHPVWVWRIGDALLIGQPGEAYSAFQEQLRAAFPNHRVLVVNLCNGPGFGYFPDDDAYRRGAYQAWQSPFARGALDALTATGVNALTSLLD